MTKENIEKISIPSTALDVKDMTPDEKKHLSSFLLEKGFTSPTFYLRFFQKGFSLWEIWEQGSVNASSWLSPK